jgi:GAF domain-containing protein
MKTPPDGSLAGPQGIIADLRRELAERTAERDQALAQQAATAEVLQVINSSPGDLAPVFDAMLEKAVRLCDAYHGVMYTQDGDHFRAVALSSEVPEKFAEFLRQASLPLGSNTFVGRVMRDRSPVHIADIRTEEPYLRRLPIAVASVEFGVRTLLSVPLLKDASLVGIFSLARQEVRRFTDKQIALLENFAAQAVIAMENTRLITETRETLDQQTATTDVLQVINSSPGDLAPVFDAMLEKAVRLSQASFGILWNFDGELARAGALHQVPEPYAALCRAPFRPSRESGPARMIRGEGTLAIVDVRDSPGYRDGDPLTRAIADLAGARSIVIAPLRNDTDPLGAITLYRQEIRPFTDKQIALLESFAAQAVIAMENARLITETREALDQQTATAEVLQVINSSPGDLAPVFDAMLEKAHALCAATRGALVTFDGELFRAVATRGLPGPFEELMRRGFPPLPGSATDGLLEGHFVHILDMPALAAESPPAVARVLRQASELAGTRTLLMVPLCKDGVLLGYIAAYRQEVRPFTDKQIALLQNFAAQAVIAMENARLLIETREALEQQTATAEVLGVINSSPGDLAPVFDTMLEKALGLCDASFGTLWTYDGDGMRAAAVRSDKPQFTEFVAQGVFPTTGVHQRLLHGEDAIQIADATEGYASLDPMARRLMDLSGTRALLAVALRKDGVFLGSFGIARREVRAFTGKQVALLQNFAAQAVIAMENARLLGELHQRTEEVAELNRGLEARVAEQVDELGRVGRLKRFLAPQLAELIVSQGDEKILESHRREIVVVFCDLRGYTAFTETAEPEEVLDFLREYHGALGPLVAQYEGTLDQFSGDGIMVFFNDPVPIPDPAERAVRMAMAMREAAAALIADWRERGRELGFGAGIAQGYATLGQIGFSERSGYTAIGTVCNVAARLCAEAKDGQILLGQRVNVALKGSVVTEQVGALALKGLTQPVIAYNVPSAASHPAFRVIEGEPRSI